MAESELKPEPKPEPESDPETGWGTVEELLLASAVNRHGVNSWDSIANQVNQSRNTNFSPNTCRLKFLDLQHRFSSADGDGDGVGGRGDQVLLWVDELRRLRVAELKRDLHRYDVSIVSLQLKVKRLKEERENSKNEERENSDLKKTDEISPEKNDGRIVESSNESISVDRKLEPLPEPIKPEPDRVSEPIRGGESCNGSTNSKESGPAEADPSERVGRVDSGELGESVAESGRGEGEEGVKESSDVQSTASLRRREKKMKGISGNSSGDENQSLASKFSIGGGGGGGGIKDNSKRKSKVLLDFLDLVRSRKCGPVFERRLETQETPRYKSLIKEHIDLGIIQKRVEEGRYTDCHTMFYRDLMLLVNNAIVFFHKRSSEYKYAAELRQLVTQHFQSHLNIKSCRYLSITPPAAPPNQTIPEVDQTVHVDLKPKLVITGPVIACRKRSSIAGKLSASAPEKKESLKKDAEKSSSTSFNAVATKRARDQSSGPRNPTSKNRSSSTQKSSPRVSSKVEISEAKADTKNSKSKQGSRPGKDLLLDVLDSEVKRKIFGNNGSGSGNFRSDRHKDHGRGSSNGTTKKSSTEKGKSKEEKESPRSKNNGRPPKKATPVVSTGKRGAEGRDSDAHAKKRQRR